MNIENVSRLERIIRVSQMGLIGANNQIKELKNQEKKLKKALIKVQDDNEQLKQLYEFEKEKYMCNICFQNQKNCIIEPCRHFAGCVNCSTKLNTCPICRKDIDSYITLFIS